MIVLDTNVVSEAMKPEPNVDVQTWLDKQAAETLYLSSVTIAELLFGIGALPVGRPKARKIKIHESDQCDSGSPVLRGKIFRFRRRANQ